MMILPTLKYALSKDFKTPLHLTLFITSKCTAKCRTCFYWKNLNGTDDLTFREIKKISRSLRKLIWLHISGGEPFLRDDLPEICELFYLNNKPESIALPTNAISTEKVVTLTISTLKKISKTPISINIALDDLYKKHDYIRGYEGCFDKMLKTYSELSKLKKEYKNLSLKITTVINSLNIHSLQQITDFVKKELPQIDYHTLIFMRGDHRDKQLFLPDITELEKIKNLLKNTWLLYSHEKSLGWLGSKIANSAHHYLLDIYYKSMRHKKQPIPCLAGKAHLVIGSAGEVYFCELLKSIGNLREVDFDFEKVWYGKEAANLRKFIKDNKCYCTHGCVWMDSVFLNPLTYPKLLRYLVSHTTKTFLKINS